MKNTEEIRSLIDKVFESNKQKNVVQEFEEKFSEKFGVKYSVSVNSGTSGLHAALYAAGVGPGDEVISPAVTVVMDSYVTLYMGATPVFVDINPDTWNIDVDEIEKNITEKTKAIIAVSLSITNSFGYFSRLLLVKNSHLSIIYSRSFNLLGISYLLY